MATFGYSVGDAFTAIAVISKIIQTLNDTRQSHSEYQNLVSDLEDLKLVFEELERYSTTTDIGTTATEHSHKNAVKGLASKYKANLLSLLDKIQKFDRSLSAKATTGKLKGQPRKLQWAFFVKDEVPSSRGQIAVMIATLHMLMSMQASSATTQQATTLDTAAKNIEAIPGLLEAGQHQISAEIVECRKALEVYPGNVRQTSQGAHLGLDRVVNTLNGFSQRIDSIANLCESTSTKLDFCKVQVERAPLLSPSNVSASGMAERAANEVVARMCQEYGYVNLQMLKFVTTAFENNIETYRTSRRELDERESQSIGREPSMLLDDNIHLVDALGRSHSLPYQCFKYWPVLQTYLQCRFADIPGERQVLNQYYDILPQRQLGRAMGPEEWQFHAFPKCRFVMSMRMALVLGRDGQACPRWGCNSSPGAVIPDTAWVSCPKCGLKFRPDPKLLVEARGSLHEQEPADEEMSHRFRKALDKLYEQEKREIELFKMIHVVVNKPTSSAHKDMARSCKFLEM